MQNKPYEGSVGDRLDRLPVSKFHTKFLLYVTGGEFIITFLVLLVGSLLAIISEVFHLSTDVSTYIMPTAFYSGMVVGTFAFGRLADIYGRRKIYFVNLLIFAFGAIIAGLMSNYILIGVFMFIAGIGTGAEIPLGDTYISETMTKRNRGRRLALVYTIGVISAPLGAFWLLEMSNINLADSWRIFLIVLGVAALVFQVIRFRMKESPRWLESVGRYKDANNLMNSIEEEVMKEKGISSLPPVESHAEVLKEKPKWIDLFDKKLRKNTIMVIIFQYAQSGVFFGFTALVPTLLIAKGYSLASTFLFSIIIYMGFLVGSLVNLLYIDKLERKIGVCLFVGLAGIFGIIFSIANNSAEIVLFGFVVAFMLWNMSNFFHQYQAEIFPTKLRGSGTGMGQGINAIASASVPTLIVVFVLSHGSLAVFSVLGILVLITIVDIMLFGPKTSQRELESISNM